jgi:hypothetical protein
MILMNHLARLFAPHCYSANFVRVSMALYYKKILWLKPCPVKFWLATVDFFDLGKIKPASEDIRNPKIRNSDRHGRACGCHLETPLDFAELAQRKLLPMTMAAMSDESFVK